MSLPLASRAAVIVAAATPFLIGVTSSPSSTYFNQAWAAAGWGLLLWGLGGQVAADADPGRRRTLALVFAAMGLFVLAGLAGPTPWGQRAIPLAATAAVAVLAAWAAQAATAARAPQARDRETLWPGLMAALLVAGAASTVIAVVQLFFPASADGLWVAHATTPGRAIGNIRQPNQLSTLLVWAAAAAVWWTVRRGASAAWLAAALVPLVAAVAMTASRTGTLGVVMLGLWGLLDRRLPARVRLVLLGSVAVYAAAWFGLSAWAEHGATDFYGRGVVDKTLHGDASSSRGGIWRDTLGLIAAQPWGGVGLGAFNFAWSTSVFPGRPVAFFDHTHNLPLQLAVELGVPVALGILGLLATAMWRARSGLRDADPATALDARTALFMLVVVGAHSQLEYPLWYLYFLVPAAVMLGHLLGQAGPAPQAAPADGAATARSARAFAVAGTLLASATVWSAVQYHHVRVIFEPEHSWGEPMSLEARIARGQASALFGQHADYAQVTMAEHPGALLARFERTRFHLLDTRLLSAWATALAEQGDVQGAAHLSARLREFRNPASRAFFEPCADPATASVAFQCAPDPRLDWRALLRRE